MLASKQQDVVKKLMTFGWVPDVNNFYQNDQQEGLAVIVRHRENVAMVYPDGSQDRAGDQPHSKCSIKPRAGWYSPVEKYRAERRVKASTQKLMQMLIQLNRHLDAQLDAQGIFA